MVLEDAYDSSPTSTYDEAPQSDPDQSSSTTGDAWAALRRPMSPNAAVQQLPSYIKLSEFPRPIPIPYLSQRRSWNDDHIVSLVTRNAASLSSLAQRRLTRPEWEAITFHCAKMNAIASYGFPLGTTAAIYRCWSTSESFRFPFYKPKFKAEGGTFDPTVFGNMLKGQWAVRQWHLLRYAMYGLLGGAFGSVVFVSYATAVAAAGQAVDTRMQELMSVVKEEAKRSRANFGNRGERQGQGQRQMPLRESDKEEMEAREEEQRNPGLDELARGADERRMNEEKVTPSNVEYGSGATSLYQEDGVDDASPTAGPQSYGSTAAEPNAWQTIRQDRAVGRMPQRDTGAQRPQAQNQPNAWMERRRESAAKTKQTPGAASGEDSFSFSSSDEERQLAKSEAQREFDARVERERKGQDFADDASPRGRWK